MLISFLKQYKGMDLIMKELAIKSQWQKKAVETCLVKSSSQSTKIGKDNYQLISSIPKTNGTITEHNADKMSNNTSRSINDSRDSFIRIKSQKASTLMPHPQPPQKYSKLLAQSKVSQSQQAILKQITTTHQPAMERQEVKQKTQKLFSTQCKQ